MKKTFEEQIKDELLKYYLTNTEILERSELISEPKERAEFIENEKQRRKELLENTLHNKGISTDSYIKIYDEAPAKLKGAMKEILNQHNRVRNIFKQMADENKDSFLDNAIFSANDEYYLLTLFSECEKLEGLKVKLNFLIQSKYGLNKHLSKYDPELSNETTYKTINDRIDEKIKELKNQVGSQLLESKITFKLKPVQAVELIQALIVSNLISGNKRDVYKEFSIFLGMDISENKYTSHLSSIAKRKPLKTLFLEELGKNLLSNILQSAEKKEK